MPTIINGKTVYQGGELLPAVGSPEYIAAQNPVAPDTGKKSLVDRYSSEKTNITNNPALNVPEPSENRIREKYRARAQGTVDAIRSQFDRYIQEDTEAKKRLESKAYLRTLASGLSGSPTGATQTYEAAEKGQEKVRKTKIEGEALVAKAYADADLRASEEFSRQRSEYLGSAQDKAKAEQDLNDKVRTTAEQELTTYATQRSYDEWAKEVGPARVQQYMQETGKDETALRSYFLSKMPKTELVNQNGTKLSDGSVVFQAFIRDEAGNITGVKEVARIRGSGGKEIKDSRITDNGVQILYTDGTYETRNADGSNGTTPTGKPVPGAPKGVTDTALETARYRLNNVGSYQGYANPYLYMDLFNDWIAKGGSRDAFIKNFPPGTYLNPDHNFLKDNAGQPLIPDYLKTTKTKKIEPTTSTQTTSTTGRSF